MYIIQAIDGRILQWCALLVLVALIIISIVSDVIMVFVYIEMGSWFLCTFEMGSWFLCILIDLR